jgi:hypothetical protein
MSEEAVPTLWTEKIVLRDDSGYCPTLRRLLRNEGEFWSAIVYTADGHLQKNDLNAYSLNSITAKKGADGSVAIQFGGCDGKISNCLPVTHGWNYMVRLYRPGEEVLSGKWKFPEAQATN